MLFEGSKVFVENKANICYQVQVDFSNNMLQHRPDFVQNDGGASSGQDRKSLRKTVDLHDILIGESLAR